MVEDDVMILDSGDEVYVWLGNESDENERVESLKLAKVTTFYLCQNWNKLYYSIMFNNS